MTSEKRQIALLSNITTDLIKLKLNKSFEVYTPSGFNGWISDVYNSDSFIYDKACEAIIVLLDGSTFSECEVIKDELKTWQEAINNLVSNASKPVIVSTIDVKPSKVRTLSEVSWAYEIQNIWSDFLISLTDNNSNSYVIDLAELVSDIGRNNFYSYKMLYLSSMPYSKSGIQAICEEISSSLANIFESKKKIIVLDLDNTLWGGVIGEDGVDGILLSNHKEGQRYYDFQKQLKRMKERGVLLAIASKNNLEDVKPVFKQSDMLLKESDFVSKKISWGDKSQSIKEIEEDLNITEGGFVFIDDNPVERNIVKGECKEVVVPEFPEDTTTLSAFAEDLYKRYFRLPRLLNEDKKKTEMYFSASKRSEAKKACSNLDDYIKSLDINLDIHEMKEDEIARVAQLCGKTNQFNLTTKCYTESDIKAMFETSGYAVFVTYVSDKYGNDGLTSVLILKKESEQISIDTFLMSCRVMGRKIENAIINEVLNKYKSYKSINASYIPTAKNKPVEKLYDQLGFSFIKENGGTKEYSICPQTYEYKKMLIFKNLSFCAGGKNED